MPVATIVIVPQFRRSESESREVPFRKDASFPRSRKTHSISMATGASRGERNSIHM